MKIAIIGMGNVGSALGQGLGVFLVDTIKWSGGRLNGGSLAMNVGVPAVLGVITTVGRSAGNWETGAQAWGSAGIGLALGLGLGALYGAAQRPECGYGGDPPRHSLGNRTRAPRGTRNRSAPSPDGRIGREQPAERAVATAPSWR